MAQDIDIIILSYAKDERLKELTIQTINSLVSSENLREIRFNILVIESEKSIAPYQYPHSTTIYPAQKFGFHTYLNIGLKQMNSEFICFCNNDLLFAKGWATAMLAAIKKDPDLLSLSPLCTRFHADKLAQLPETINYGYTNGVHFTGWCFLAKRTLFDTIGLFDEHFKFWYCDDDFRLTLKKYGKKNALIKDSVVEHLCSETLTKVPSKEKLYLQYISFAYYKYKWEHHNFMRFLIEKAKYQFKIIIHKG